MKQILILTLSVIFCSTPALAKKKQAVKPLPSAVKVAPPASPPIQEEIVRGRVYERGSDRQKLLFNYTKKSLHKDGEIPLISIRYDNLDGTPAHEETYHLKGRTVQSYEFFQRQVDESGSVEIVDGKINFKFTADGKTKTETEKAEGLLIVPAAIYLMVQDNWDKLMAGETVDTRFLAVERLETVGFSFKKKKEIQYDGKDAVVLEMAPTAFLIKALVKPIKMTLEKAAPHRLLETDGRLPVRMSKIEKPARNDWKAIDAVLVLDYSGK